MSKLKIRNNWGVLEHSWRGKSFTPDQVESVVVEWPNGTRTKESVQECSSIVEVSDHGHTYPVQQMTMSMTKHIRGHRVDLRIGRELSAKTVKRINFKKE